MVLKFRRLTIEYELDFFHFPGEPSFEGVLIFLFRSKSYEKTTDYQNNQIFVPRLEDVGKNELGEQNTLALGKPGMLRLYVTARH